MTQPSRPTDTVAVDPAESPPRILLVDDDETVRRTLVRWLKQEGYEPLEARDGESGVQAAQSGEFDAVLCDVNLPDGLGLDFVTRLRDREPALPVVLITGQPSVETAARAVGLPVAAYLCKPLDIGALRTVLAQAVGRHRHYRGLAADRARLQRWDEELARLQANYREAPKVDAGTVAVDYLRLTLTQVIGMLADLERTVGALAAHPGPTVPLRDLDLLNAVRHTIAVLERTRQQFKSKELGELRRQLDSLLARRDSGSA